MPHSLKSKVKSLCYKGELSEKERDKIIHALEITQGTEDKDYEQGYKDGVDVGYTRGYTDAMSDIYERGDNE